MVEINQYSRYAKTSWLTAVLAIGAGDTGSKGVLEGFKNVVKTGLSTILGHTSAGESYDKKFFVCVKQYAHTLYDR